MERAVGVMLVALMLAIAGWFFTRWLIDTRYDTCGHRFAFDAADFGCKWPALVFPLAVVAALCAVTAGVVAAYLGLSPRPLHRLAGENCPPRGLFLPKPREFEVGPPQTASPPMLTPGATAPVPAT